jgi:tagatose-1,6-bisphosphate aldolase
MMRTMPSQQSAMTVLVGRLNAGWSMCQTEKDPAKRERLEDHWIALLHDYEAVCDRSMSREVV